MPGHYQCGWLKSDATWKGAGVVSNSLHNYRPSIKTDPPKLHSSETSSSVLFWSPQGPDTHMTNIHTSMQNIHTIKIILEKQKKKKPAPPSFPPYKEASGNTGLGCLHSRGPLSLLIVYSWLICVTALLWLKLSWDWRDHKPVLQPQRICWPWPSPASTLTRTLRYTYTSF